MNSCSFPLTRMRRTRSKRFIRNLVKENLLTVNDLIYPIFIVDGNDKKEPIPEMPGLFRYSLTRFLINFFDLVLLILV